MCLIFSLTMKYISYSHLHRFFVCFTLFLQLIPNITTVNVTVT